MKATLYSPHEPPRVLPNEGFVLPDPATLVAQVPAQVSAFLGCVAELVDVLVSGPRYVAYSVFDYEGELNHAAMKALTEVSGESFDLKDEEAVVCGPVLVVVG